MLYMKKFLSLLLVLGLLGSSQVALAAEESPAPLPVWSHSILADGYSLGLFGDEISVQHSQTVTMEQVEALAQTVEDKLALLDLEPRPADGTALVLDTTRGGVMNALYQEAAAYAFPGVEQGPEAFMTSVGALAGDGSGLHLDRPCTVLEAAAMANSLILNLYDRQDAGSLGLLWRADNGRGNVLYLLGSIHTDRNNLYPFHKQLRDVILNAEQVSFELDFNDTDQLLEFAALQTYPAGDSLANHISPALYQAVVQAAAQLGMDEGTVSQYKPWALANSFASLATLDETSSENAMAIDLYVNAKAVNAGIDIGAVETYAFQGGIFDGLSAEYQEAYLDASLAGYEGMLNGEAADEAAQALAQAQQEQIAAMFDAWKSRDPDALAEVYGKEAILNSDDELNSKLFTERDPGMIAAAAEYLETEGENTFFLAVGAGHMVGDTGVVQGLRDLGYTVELVPVP